MRSTKMFWVSKLDPKPLLPLGMGGWCCGVEPPSLVPKQKKNRWHVWLGINLGRSPPDAATIPAPQMAQMWRQSVRCYMDVAQHDAAQGRCADALRWVAKV